MSIISISRSEYAFIRFMLVWTRRIKRNHHMIVHVLSTVMVFGLTAAIVLMVLGS